MLRLCILNLPDNSLSRKGSKARGEKRGNTPKGVVGWGGRGLWLLLALRHEKPVKYCRGSAQFPEIERVP